MANPAKLTVRTIVPNSALLWPVPDVIDTTGMVPVVAADTDSAAHMMMFIVNSRGAVSLRVAPGDLPPSVRRGLGDLTVPLAPLTASLIVAPAGANNDVLYTADTPGGRGNDISVQYIDPGAASQALRVSVQDHTAIRVHLATDGTKAITSTAAQVIAAVNAHFEAGLLVTASNAPSNNGSGVVTAMAEDFLEGGADLDATHAELTIAPAGDNNDITWTATVGGAAGNDITIEYVDPAGVDQPLTVTVLGTAITISLATGGGGAITSTANSIIAGVAGTPDAAALVWGANHGTDTGAGVVTAMAAAPLMGGADLAAVYGPFESARFVQDNGDLNINFEILNGEADVIAVRLPRR